MNLEKERESELKKEGDLDLREEAVVAARLEELIDGFVWSIGVVRWSAAHGCPSAGLVGAAVAHNATTTPKFLTSVPASASAYERKQIIINRNLFLWRKTLILKFKSFNPGQEDWLLHRQWHLFIYRYIEKKIEDRNTL